MNGDRRWFAPGRLRIRLALLVSVLLIVAGCGGGADDGSTVEPRPAVAHRQLRVDGMDRTYRLYTPPDVEVAGAVPLVLALHGSGNSADSLVGASELDQAASAGGFIVAYPEALGLLWNGGFCCTSGRGDRATDVHFLDQVVTDISAVRRIDRTRIYAVGVSAGGIMAYRLACDLADRFAGIGVIAASMVLDDCHPSRAVSVIAIHGTADPIVPYEGGRIQGGAIQPAPAATAVVERWASLDGCPDARTSEARGAVTVAAWAGCAGGTKVQLVSVEGGGHNWFLPVYGPPNGLLDATVAVTEFFGLARR
jgi:polyhydroxybutyrate depolymerase